MTEQKILASKTEQELQIAKEFLKNQLGKEKKSFKIRLIAGAVISVIVFGYMWWLSATLTMIGTPEYVREAFITTIRSNAPELVAMAKRQILGNKKELVDFLTKEGADKLVIVLMDEGKKELQKLISRITNETVDELNAHFVAVLKKDNSRLRAVLADPDKLHLEEEIVKAFDDDLQESMGQMKFDEDFDEPMSVKLRESLAELNKINRSLQSMADSKTLSRREVLMVRFIKSWTSYVQQAGSEDERTQSGGCDDGSTAAGIPPKCQGGLVRAQLKGEWKCVNPGTCQ
jgi:hypothetical protein